MGGILKQTAAMIKHITNSFRLDFWPVEDGDFLGYLTFPCQSGIVILVYEYFLDQTDVFCFA
jgi:hypothetical protein